MAHYGRPLRDVPIRMDAGDIVLVSMRGISLSHTVKVTTRSKWDHVGMVVKLRDKTALRLFEATMEGVETYFLNGSLQAYRSHAVVRLRLPLVHDGNPARQTDTHTHTQRECAREIIRLISSRRATPR